MLVLNYVKFIPAVSSETLHIMIHISNLARIWNPIFIFVL